MMSPVWEPDAYHSRELPARNSPDVHSLASSGKVEEMKTTLGKMKALPGRYLQKFNSALFT